MSGRQHLLRPIRLAATVVVAAALAAGARTGAADAQQQGAQQQGAQQQAGPGKPEHGSIFKRIWGEITGDKGADRGSAPAAEAAPEPPAPAPSLATAEWVGFTPALAVGAADGPGVWIAGPFPQAGAEGWVTDTVSGLSTPVRLVWREAEPGSLARLSAEAAAALGLSPGAVVNVAIYVAR